VVPKVVRPSEYYLAKNTKIHKISGVKPSEGMDFVRWRLIFVGPQCELAL
jgi:hypothetical protein